MRENLRIMAKIDYKVFQQYASFYGLIVGVTWLLAFYFSIYGISVPGLGLLGDICVVAAPVTAFFLAKSYRDKVLSGGITFGNALYFFFSLYVYACIILAAGQFIYFTYLDQGFLYNTYKDILAQPAYQQMLRSMANTQQVNLALEQFREATYQPIGMVFGFMGFHLVISFILSFFCALFLKQDPYKGLKRPVI